MTRNRAEVLAIVKKQASEFGPAEGVRLIQDRVEHRLDVAGRGIDYLQYLGGGDLLGESLITLDRSLGQLPLRFVQLGSALDKLTLQIGCELLGIGERAVGCRAHLRTSLGPTLRADHTVIITATTGC